MQEVDANVQRITAALPRADWASLAEAAQAIQGSFVLQQQLTAQQRAELHRALPQAFLALDASFQDTAERLGAAARRREADLTAFYTYKLLDACTSCHARYAPHRSHAFGAEAPKGH